MTKRTIKTYFPNPNRDTRYDAALREHLAATANQPGRTHSKIARDLGLGDPSKDKPYGMAIMWALQEFVAEDARTVSWTPHLRLPEASLAKKLETSKHAGHDLRLYKHSRERKVIDRDPSRTDEVVQGVIRGILRAEGPRSGLAIMLAVQNKLGHVCKRVVRRCLESLVLDGPVTAEKTGLKNTTLYTLVAPTSVVPSVVP